MAEERLIDADKDKKYKIRKNADGEDELYIEGDVEEQEEVEEMGFEIPEFEEDDEEAAATLSAEQLADLIKAREEEVRKTQEEIARLTAILNENKENGNWEGVIKACDTLTELDGETEWAYCEKLIALTQNFTDYSRQEEIIKTAEQVKDYALPEQKQTLKDCIGEDFYASLSTSEQKVAQLKAENEQKKEARRPAFRKSAINAGIFFGCALVPFITFLVLAISYYGVMFANQDGSNVILTIIFACLTVLAFVVLLIATRKLSNALRILYLNNKDTSTSLGREYVEENAKYIVLKSIEIAINSTNEN